MNNDRHDAQDRNKETGETARHDKIFSLDDALHDAVANPQFVVTAPDRVTVELWFSKTTKTVPLSTLVPKE